MKNYICLILALSLLSLLKVNAQTFVQWNEGTLSPAISGLVTINGTVPFATVVVTNTGTGIDVNMGQEFTINNLNLATAAEIFATFGATSNGASKSLTFTFSTPVIINSFSVNDIDKGVSWDDAFNFTGVTFTSVTAGGGVSASTTGTTFVPTSGGTGTEFATWITSTTAITSFSMDYVVTAGKTHAYLGYSMEISQPTGISIVGDSVFCNGDSVLLTAINDTVHSWYNTATPGTLISTNDSIVVNPNITTTYMAIGTADTAYHTITYLNDVQSFSLGVDTTLCFGQSLTLSGITPNATDYFWYDSTIVTAQTINQAGVYWVESSNFCSSFADTIAVSVINPLPLLNLGPDATICSTQGITLDGTTANAVNYLWNDLSTDTTLTTSTTGTYWVEASNSCFSVSDTVNIIVDEPVAPINLGSDTILCIGQQLNLDATANNTISYLWNTGDTLPTITASTTGTYSVEASSFCGSEFDTLQLTIIDLDLDLGNDTLVCLGATVNVVTNLPGVTHLWNDLSTSENLFVTSAGTYWVDVSVGVCTESDTIEITTQEIIPDFSTPVLAGCEPFSIDQGFTDLSSINTGNIVAWQWSFGNGETSTLANPTTIYATQGSYDVSMQVTSNIGCVAQILKPNYITSHPQVVAYFSPNNGIAFTTTDFINESTYSDSWLWILEDGVTSTDENPSHTFINTGEQSVTLFATNIFGCGDSVTIPFTVAGGPTIYAPNSFTPNGDEHNNLWRVYVSGIDVSNFTISVFNRWGELIWESRDPDTGWDGSYNGLIVKEGSYVWRVSYDDQTNGTRLTDTGHITILK